MLRIIKRFYRHTDENLLALAISVSRRMSDNAQYSDEKNRLDELAQLIDSFPLMIAATVNGGKLHTLRKTQQRERLVELLDELAKIVELKARKQESVLVDSGFETRHANINRRSSGVADIPRNLRAAPTLVAGELKISVDAQPHVVAYVFQYAAVSEGPDAYWQMAPSRSRTTVVSNLASGQYYRFRVVAICRNDLIVTSGEIKKIVE